MIKEVLTVSLSAGQAQLFATWTAQENNIVAARNTAASAILAGHVDLEEVQGCRIEIAEKAIVVTPPAESLKLEA